MQLTCSRAVYSTRYSVGHLPLRHWTDWQTKQGHKANRCIQHTALGGFHWVVYDCRHGQWICPWELSSKHNTEKTMSSSSLFSSVLYGIITLSVFPPPTHLRFSDSWSKERKYKISGTHKTLCVCACAWYSRASNIWKSKASREIT